MITNAKRDLSVGDVAAIVAAVAHEQQGGAGTFDVVARIAAETCGYRMLTVLEYDEPAGEVVRRYSSDARYPVGGRKRLSQYPTNHAAIEAQGYFLAGTREAVRQTYADHEALFALGVTAILNAPISYSGRRLGTLNFSGEEGQYGPREVAIAKTLAGLLVPVLLEPPLGSAS